MAPEIPPKEPSEKSGGFAVLDDGLAGQATAFRNPVARIRCDDPDDLIPCIEKLEQVARAGQHCLGYITYEAGYLLEDRLTHLYRPDGTPLLDFMVFDAPTPFDGFAADDIAIPAIRFDQDERAFTADIARILDLIAAGDVYQINHTFRATFDAPADPFALYSKLRHGQLTRHGAYLDFGDRQVLSLSPELFIDKSGPTLTTRPMKGTAPRGVDAGADKAIQDQLYHDPKSRAENLMIVDLIRNDLSRIATAGSVHVPKLFSIETWRSFNAMTSTVEGQATDDLTLAALMMALFPCGSVTGAPKIRAMEIIADLEQSPRGVYCGAVGWIGPGRRASGRAGDFDLQFNVPIRTIDISDGKGRLGIGAGIVADSKPKSEYEECLLKARFLTHPMDDIGLIETTRWQAASGPWHWQAHLQRLEASANHLLIPFDGKSVQREMLRQLMRRETDDDHRLRVELKSDGAIDVTLTPEPAPPTGGSIALAAGTTSSTDMLLQHKTTRRAVYNQALKDEALTHGHLDVIFLNEKGEVTEGSRTNIFAVKDDVWTTPPVTCGLLPGTARAGLLADPDIKTQEAVLTIKDLQQADALYICNSVMGTVPVTLSPLP